MNITAILEKTVSSDKNELEAALQFLQRASVQNLPELLRQLSDELRHGTDTKRAGIRLRNALHSVDPDINLRYQQRWMSFPDDLRIYIKTNVLETLGSETMRPSNAAQCVAYIACAELPQKQWPELIQVLTNNVTNPGSTEMVKEASLEAIGYICQDIDPKIPKKKSNEFLTAICIGMKEEEPSNHVRLAATKALCCSLKCFKATFCSDNMRYSVMQVVLKATESSDTPVRVSALSCLVKIMRLYYIYMDHYMESLIPITLEAMKSNIGRMAFYGIKFWTTLCDKEYDLYKEAKKAGEPGKPPEKRSRNHAKKNLMSLVPILTQTLAKQEEFHTCDKYETLEAAGACLASLALICEDDIVPHVLSFVTEHIKSPDWRFREAAATAFGCILKGPNSDTLKPIVERVMPTLIGLLKDPDLHVRDSTCYAIRNICKLFPKAVINVLNLFKDLTLEPKVAVGACWAFTSLAEAAYVAAEKTDDQTEPATYCLSSYYEPIVQKLLETTDRSDGCQHNLRGAAYEALMEMVKNSPKDCYVTVQKTTTVILKRLQHVLQMEGQIKSTSVRVKLNDLQSLLCATLRSGLRKVEPTYAHQISDEIMGALLHMLSTSSGKAEGVQEDALLAVSTLIEVLGELFIENMDGFKVFLTNALRNHKNYQVCQAAVGLFGDLCRALGNKVFHFSDDVMSILLENLRNEQVNRCIKPTILSVFGDVALAIGPEFVKHLPIVLPILMLASQAKVGRSNDKVNYLNELRKGCLEAYTGIVQGLKEDNKAIEMLLKSNLQHVVAFLNDIAAGEEHSESVIGASCGLIGALCSAFGATIMPFIETELIQGFLENGRRSDWDSVRCLVWEATRKIENMRSGGGGSQQRQHQALSSDGRAKKNRGKKK